MKRLILFTLFLLLSVRVAFADLLEPFRYWTTRTSAPTRVGAIWFDGTSFRQVLPGGDAPIPSAGFDPSSNQTITGNWDFSNRLELSGGALLQNNLVWSGSGSWSSGTTSGYPNTYYGRYYYQKSISDADTRAYATGWGGLALDTDAFFYLRRENAPGGLVLRDVRSTQTVNSTYILYTHNDDDSGLRTRASSYAGGTNKGWQWTSDGIGVMETYWNSTLAAGGHELGSASASVYSTQHINPFADGDRIGHHVIDHSTSVGVNGVWTYERDGGTIALNTSETGGVATGTWRANGTMQIQSPTSTVGAGTNVVNLNPGSGTVSIASADAISKLSAGSTGRSLLLLAGFPGTQYIGFGDNISAPTIATLGKMQQIGGRPTWSVGQAGIEEGVFQALGRPFDNRVGALELQDDNTGGVESVFLFKREGEVGVRVLNAYPTDPDTEGNRLAELERAQTWTAAQTFSVGVDVGEDQHVGIAGDTYTIYDGSANAVNTFVGGVQVSSVKKNLTWFGDIGYTQHSVQVGFSSDTGTGSNVVIYDGGDDDPGYLKMYGNSGASFSSLFSGDSNEPRWVKNAIPSFDNSGSQIALLDTAQTWAATQTFGSISATGFTVGNNIIYGAGLYLNAGNSGEIYAGKSSDTGAGSSITIFDGGTDDPGSLSLYAGDGGFSSIFNGTADLPYWKKGAAPSTDNDGSPIALLDTAQTWTEEQTFGSGLTKLSSTSGTVHTSEVVSTTIRAGSGGTYSYGYQGQSDGIGAAFPSGLWVAIGRGLGIGTAPPSVNALDLFTSTISDPVVACGRWQFNSSSGLHARRAGVGRCKITVANVDALAGVFSEEFTVNKGIINSSVGGTIAATSVYGNLYINNEGGLGVAITTGGTYVPINGTSWTVGTVKGANYLTGATNGDLTCGTFGAGVYEANWQTTFGGDTNQVYHAALFKDGVIIASTTSARKLPAAPADQGSMSGFGLVTLASGNVVDLRITSVSDTTNATIYHAKVVLKRIESTFAP